MAELFGFSHTSVARIWRAVLAVERYVLPRSAALGAGERTRRPARSYRRFTLTSQLDGGESAEVEWDDSTTGTVMDPDTCCCGRSGRVSQ